MSLASKLANGGKGLCCLIGAGILSIPTATAGYLTYENCEKIINVQEKGMAIIITLISSGATGIFGAATLAALYGANHYWFGNETVYAPPRPTTFNPPSIQQRSDQPQSGK